MNKREKNSFPAVGGSSLLVIFAVLCLTIFTLLGLSTVQAGGRLSDASAEAVSAYYAADCHAEEILARLRAGELPEGVSVFPDGTYSYTCPISDTQLLAVEVRVDMDENYEILRWQAASAANWQPDDSLPVWDGTIREEEMMFS